VQEDDVSVETFLAKPVQQVGQLLEVPGVVTGVNADRNSRLFASLAYFLDGRDQQASGQIIDTVVAQVLQDT
jgi:hypothetical protein